MLRRQTLVSVWVSQRLPTRPTRSCSGSGPRARDLQTTRPRPQMNHRAIFLLNQTRSIRLPRRHRPRTKTPLPPQRLPLTRTKNVSGTPPSERLQQPRMDPFRHPLWLIVSEGRSASLHLRLPKECYVSTTVLWTIRQSQLDHLL